MACLTLLVALELAWKSKLHDVLPNKHITFTVCISMHLEELHGPQSKWGKKPYLLPVACSTLKSSLSLSHTHAAYIV